MGREVRRVPADWQHPKQQVPDRRTGVMVERYKPLLGGSWAEAAREWDAAREKWERGEFPEYASEESRKLPYDQWNGPRPFSEDYMPDWPAEQRTHLMMYEDTSEGTPLSPAFKTPEEVARWCADNGASWFGRRPGAYEDWLSIARGAFQVSAICTPETGFVYGVVLGAESIPSQEP